MSISYCVITRGCTQALPFLVKHARRFSSEIVVGIDRFFPDDGTEALARQLDCKTIDFTSKMAMGMEQHYRAVCLAAAEEYCVMADDDWYFSTDFQPEQARGNVNGVEMLWVMQATRTGLTVLDRGGSEKHRVVIRPKQIKYWDSHAHVGGFRDANEGVLGGTIYHLEAVLKSLKQRIEIGRQHGIYQAGAERYDCRTPELVIGSKFKVVDPMGVPPEMWEHLALAGKLLEDL